MIIPTIQTHSLEDLQSKLDAYAAVIKIIHDEPESGVRQMNGSLPTHFQIDIVDGLYADDLTVMPHDLSEIDWHGYTFENHLLTVDPEEFIGEANEAGAIAMIAQIERLRDRIDFLKVVKQLNHKAGLALDIYTPVEELSDEELNLADIILLMAVPAGFSGQEFKPHIFTQIKDLKARGFNKIIEIDGGINPENAKALLEAGATHLAVNSFLWHNDTVEENLKLLLGIHAQNS